MRHRGRTLNALAPTAILKAIAAPCDRTPPVVFGLIAATFAPGMGWLWHWAPAIQWMGATLVLLSALATLARDVACRRGRNGPSPLVGADPRA